MNGRSLDLRKTRRSVPRLQRYGHQARLVGHNLDRIDEGIAALMQWTVGTNNSVQNVPRKDELVFKPMWLVVALRTPRYANSSHVEDSCSHILSPGLISTGEVRGWIIEGSFRSLWVPLGSSPRDRKLSFVVPAWQIVR